MRYCPVHLLLGDEVNAGLKPPHTPKRNEKKKIHATYYTRTLLAPDCLVNRRHLCVVLHACNRRAHF